MDEKYITLKFQNFPSNVYIPFGDNREYNELVLNYNISTNGGSWRFEFYDDVLESEIPLIIELSDKPYEYIIKYMDNEYIGKLVGSNIITDILDINLKNTIKYELEIHYDGSSYPIDEIISFIYEFFHWKNINVQYEMDEHNNRLDLYIGTNVGWIDYDDCGGYWKVFNSGLNLDALCYRTAQLSQYYKDFLKRVGWFYVGLNTVPHTYDIAFYNSDHTRLNRRDKFRVIESIRPYLYKDKKNFYFDSVKEYYNRLNEWIVGAIEVGKDLNYPKDYFTDLRNATNELVSPDFRQIVAERYEDSENKERILSLGVYDKTAFDLGLIKIDGEDTTPTTDSLTVDIEKLNEENVRSNNSKIDNKEVDKDNSGVNSNNIMEKVKESMKNMSTLIDRM